MNGSIYRCLWAAVLLAAATFTGCAGRSDVMTLPRADLSTVSTPNSTAARTQFDVKLIVPKAAAAPATIHGRRPLYISVDTQSVSLQVSAINGTAPPGGTLTTLTPISSCTLSGGTYTCALSLTIPLADNSFSGGTETVTYSIATYGTPNGTGTTLSSTNGTSTWTITKGTANSVTVTLQPNDQTLVTPSEIVIPFDGSYTSDTATFTVSSEDASGATITSGTYINPIALSIAGISGAASVGLSSSSITSVSGDSVTLSLGSWGFATPKPTPSIGVTLSGTTATIPIVGMVPTTASGSPGPAMLALTPSGTITTGNTATFGIQESGYGKTQGYAVAAALNGPVSISCGDTNCIPSSPGAVEYVTVTDPGTTAYATPVPLTITDGNGGTMTAYAMITGAFNFGSIGGEANSCTQSKAPSAQPLSSTMIGLPSGTAILQGPNDGCLDPLSIGRGGFFSQMGSNCGGTLSGVGYGRDERDTSTFGKSQTNNEIWGPGTTGSKPGDVVSVAVSTSMASCSIGKEFSGSDGGNDNPTDVVFNLSATTYSQWNAWVIWHNSSLADGFVDQFSVSSNVDPVSNASRTQTGKCETPGVLSGYTYGVYDNAGSALFLVGYDGNIYRCASSSGTFPSTATAYITNSSVTPGKPVEALYDGTTTLVFYPDTAHGYVYAFNPSCTSSCSNLVKITVPMPYFAASTSNNRVMSLTTDPKDTNGLWAAYKNLTSGVAGECRIDLTSFLPTCFQWSTSSDDYPDDIAFTDDGYLMASVPATATTSGNQGGYDSVLP